MSEEICGDDILLDAIAFSETRHFEDAVDAFKERNRSLFMKHASNQGDGNDYEHSHDLYHAFQTYQQLIEDLFDDFISENEINRIVFFNSFRAVANGHFTPIFGVHQHQWFVDMLVSWTEYDEFVRLMCKNISDRQSHK